MKKKHRPGMKWYLKLVVFLAVATLVLYIGGMIYLVKAKYEMNAYVRRMDTVFHAAAMVNAEVIHMQADRAMIARYGSEGSVIVPENYKALKSYLMRDHARPLIARIDRKDALHIAVCESDHLYVQGDRDGQGALILLESGKDRYTMHVSGGDIWQKILDISLEGSYRAENLPI